MACIHYCTHYYRLPCNDLSGDSYVIVYPWYEESGGYEYICGTHSSYWVTSRTQYAYVKFHTSSLPNYQSLGGFSHAVYTTEGLFTIQ